MNSGIGGKLFLTLTVLSVGLHIMAQELKELTLEHLIPGGETYLFAENLYGLQWWGDVCVKPMEDSLFSVNPITGKETLLTTLEKVNNSLNSPMPQAQDGLNTVISHFYKTEFPWEDKPYMLIKTPQKYIVYNFEKDQCVEVFDFVGEALADNVDFCPEGNHIAYTVRNNLYVDNAAVTDEPDHVVCGKAVHRNEFGIGKGTFWSPHGNLLAFYRMDEGMVTQYPLVDISSRVGQVENIRYPMAGMTSHVVQVGIYNPVTGQTIFLDTGDATDRYFTNISWSNDESSVFLIEVNRDQNIAQLCQYSAITGQLVNVWYKEEHPKYVEPMVPIQFLPWDDTLFIYQSQRDGYNHLYLFDISKRESGETQKADGGGAYTQYCRVKQLTSGNWLVGEFLGFNTKRKEILFTAVEGLKSGILAVSVNGKMRWTFEQCGESEHKVQLSKSGDFLIDRYATKDNPRKIRILQTSSLQGIDLLSAESPYKGYVIPDIETGMLKAADGETDLYYRLIKPSDFDPRKQYPVIVYVYGGPHAQMVTGGWLNGARGWELYMANKGYIIFCLDNRGSSNRGLAFENVIYRYLGVEACKDQVKGIEYLATLPYVDSKRIGVHGWSFGGYMTIVLMLRHPDIYKVGVAGGPVIDWKYYEVMYGERYMDMPQDNPEGYEATNLNNLAGRLEGRLLLIYDDHDDVCMPQHTLTFLKACVKSRTYPDLFIYPGHKHNVVGRDRVHLYEKITRYFEQNL